MADNKKNRKNNRNNNQDDNFNPKFRKMRKKVCPNKEKRYVYYAVTKTLN